MNRRKFLRNTASLGMFPFLGSAFPFNYLKAASPLLLDPCDVTDRSIVIVYLRGGNDIFNTNVPLDQLSLYNNLRPSLALPESSLITLDSSLPDNQQIGLHPVLTGFKDLYDSGKLAVIQGVGYENMTRSHFGSKSNWWRGNGGPEVYPDGWISRFLYDRYPAYSGGPFGPETDPLGLLFGDMNNGGFYTEEDHAMEIAMSGKDSDDFYSVISTVSGDPIANIPDSHHGQKLAFLESVAASLNVYASGVQQVFNNGSNDAGVVYPDTDLAYQLKTVAKMLSGGSRTKIFTVSNGSFDFHGGQVIAGDTTTGWQAGQLSRTFNSIKAFQDDLQAQNLEDKVLTIVFSEFGRKAVQNGNMGTDHGTLSNAFFIGKGVEAGVIGTNMDLSNLYGGAPSNSQLQHTFHKMFTTALQDWLGANDESVNTGVFYNSASPYTTQKLNLINEANIVPASCYFTPIPVQVCGCMQLKVMLEAFYDTNTVEMKTDLANSAVFPTDQPYADPPFNYNGTESFTTLPTDTVDWLLIELRNAADLTEVVARQAVLVRKDGFIMQTDGTLGASFPDVIAGDYHLAVFHRNHLSVISSEIVDTDNQNYLYDFTSAVNKAKGEGQLKLIGTHYVMLAGDISANHIIDNEDYNQYSQNQGNDVGYSPYDFNGDENVDALDYDLWYDNRYKIGALK